MSNQDIEQYREFIEKLQREDQRPAALNDFKNLIIYKPANEVASAIRNVGISNIVQCLNLEDKLHIELTCEILKICFDKFNPGDIVRHYTSHLMYLLRHEKVCVRRLAVDEVYKTVNIDPALMPVPEYIDVFVAVAQLILDQDVGITNRAVSITSNLPLEAYDKILDEMKIALEFGSSTKCNAYEIIVNISSKSGELLKLSVDHGYINSMLSEIQSDDVLYQMNILELLTRLAVTQHGMLYLRKCGALNKIAEIITEFKDNPLSGLLTAGYVKFFGSIAHHYPKEIFDKYPMMVDLLFNAFESNDQALLPLALDTLGFIGSTIEGKLCLAAIGSKFILTVGRVGEMIKNSATDIKIRALYCLANLICVDKEPATKSGGLVDLRVTLMTREWFRSLSERPSAMEVLAGFCKNPFPDIKLAAFILLDAVCQHQWGEDYVATTAGFVEYILDRSVDHTKETKEAKYDIIKRLSQSKAFKSSIATRLQRYVEQGPFYAETSMQVAMEEED